MKDVYTKNKTHFKESDIELHLGLRLDETAKFIFKVLLDHNLYRGQDKQVNQCSIMEGQLPVKNYTEEFEIDLNKILRERNIQVFSVREFPYSEAEIIIKIIDLE